MYCRVSSSAGNRFVGVPIFAGLDYCMLQAKRFVNDIHTHLIYDSYHAPVLAVTVIGAIEQTAPH